MRQFSTPGGIPSHVSVPTPGSIHEGGELGYSLVHAFGAAFDNPDLLVACVIGDGEAETGPLEGSWKGVRFLNPARDGAVLPILQLNETKISGPTVLGRAPEDEIAALLSRPRLRAAVVEGDDPRAGPPALRQRRWRAATTQIHAIQDEARDASGQREAPDLAGDRPAHPEGLDRAARSSTACRSRGPSAPIRCRCRACARTPSTWRSSRSGCAATGPRSTSTTRVASSPELARPWRRAGDEAHGRDPPRQRRASAASRSRSPELEDYAIAIERPGRTLAETTRAARRGAAGRSTRDNRGRFRLFCPDETNSNRLGAVFEAEDRCLMDARPDDEHVSPEGRVMEVLSEHLCQGWLEGYLLTGRHGLFATYEAFAMVSASMAIQHAKWLEAAAELRWREPVASLNVLLTSTCWRNDHNGFSHQGPGLIDTMISLRGERGPRLPAARRQHAALGRRALPRAAATTST